MSNPINDGGPAFARPISQGHRDYEDAQTGMTLRDYFAAKALAGMLANSEPEFCKLTCVGDYGTVAGWAYFHADAMLKAREVTP